jgi:hypothetical protein
VLPRVGAALTQFLAPIVSGPDGHAAVNQHHRPQAPPPKRKQKRQNKGDQQREERHLNLVSEVSSNPTQEALPTPTNSSKTGPNQSGATNAFLQLFDSLNEKRALLMRWLGSRAYQSTIMTQKKSGIFRKGTMLDQKAE